MMRMRFLGGCLCGLLLAAGCAHTTAPSPHPAPKPAPPIITPDLRPIGHVETVNPAGRFVVVSFANAPMPALEARLGVYRNGQKIGEVKITGPQREVNIVADIVTGDPHPQDEVKPD